MHVMFGLRKEVEGQQVAQPPLPAILGYMMYLTSVWLDSPCHDSPPAGNYNVLTLLSIWAPVFTVSPSFLWARWFGSLCGSCCSLHLAIPK